MPPSVNVFMSNTVDGNSAIIDFSALDTDGQGTGFRVKYDDGEKSLCVVVVVVFERAVCF